MAQHLCDIKWGFLIGSKCFVPQPKVGQSLPASTINSNKKDDVVSLQVEAVVLKLTPLVRPRVEVDYNTFEKVVKNLFQYRRKFVRRGTM